MASTKIQFKYGQWSQAEAMAMATNGVVVFSGATKEIYVDGKVFAGNITTEFEALKIFREHLRVEEYAQASFNDAKNALTIFGIKQGTGAYGENDGKIVKGEVESLVVNLDGSYDEETNKVATESTVNTAINNLRAEILGTLDPEELDKTIDTIKEIQETLKGGTFVTKTTYVVDPETGLPTTEVENTESIQVERNVDGNDVTYKVKGTDEVVATATMTDGVESEPTYEAGYSDLRTTPNVDSLLAKIEANEESIQAINDANLVTVEENVTNEFVTSTKSADETPVYTIGVNYGTFKTGHEAVMDAESPAYVNGIATVEDVQKYIEERLSWTVYETSVENTINMLNDTVDGGEAVITDNASANESIIITKNN